MGHAGPIGPTALPGEHGLGRTVAQAGGRAGLIDAIVSADTEPAA